MWSNSVRKTVLITGCSLGGIGDALAQSFHRKGHRVFATARDLSKVKHLRAMGLTTLQLDTVDESSVKSAVESVKEGISGTLDILVNNAGIGETLRLVAKDRLNESDRQFRLLESNSGRRS
jgi:1-acylglycerone phosphate reductase